MEIRVIKDAKSINIKNESFEIFGKLIPSYDGKKWRCTEEIWPANEVTQMCFPDEEYNPLESDAIFLGAFDEDECIGLAVLEDKMFKHMYISDLKVSQDYRRMGIGRRLVERALQIAKSKGYRGLYAIGQDNNLGACRFYLKTGFEIGGFDSMIYSGTKQAGKSNVIFYREDPITYKMATVNDAAKLVELYKDSFKDDFEKYGDFLEYCSSVEQMAASIQRNPKHIIMWGDEPIGVLSYSHESRGVYDIGSIAIIEKYQRMGIGYQVFNYILTLCEDWEKITARTPIGKKEKIKFYIEKNGFDIVGKEMVGQVEVAKLELKKVRRVDYTEYDIVETKQSEPEATLEPEVSEERKATLESEVLAERDATVESEVSEEREATLESEVSEQPARYSYYDEKSDENDVDDAARQLEMELAKLQERIEASLASRDGSVEDIYASLANPQ